jgi:hypothetical protein
LISLNPEVQQSMTVQFPLIDTYQSKVPGLLRSTHTYKIDVVMKLMEGWLTPEELAGPSSQLYFTCVQQEIRLNIFNRNESLPLQGIVIFGMIMPRHGLTVENVRKLAKKMDEGGLSPALRIVIAGKESDKDLVRDLRELAKKLPRLYILGQLASFEQLAGCKYAISLDKLGYRDNASAMVNVLREGHLLFSLRSGEGPDGMIADAVRTMQLCEQSPHAFHLLLAQQQPRLRATAPEVVGKHLGLFFKGISDRLDGY